MTKLKNTKKGMAKKALSISLVAAMLATSNVPVWAAEFTDGEVAAFTSEMEAPVVEETVDVPVTQAIGDTWTVTLKDMPSETEWGTTKKFTVETKDAEQKTNLTGLKYVWKNAATGLAVTDPVDVTATMELTAPVSTDGSGIGTSYALYIYDDNGDFEYTSPSSVLETRQNLKNQNVSFSYDYAATGYTGKEVKPEVTINAGSTNLVKKDFNVDYTGNPDLINIDSEVTITVTAVNNKLYTGALTETFKIGGRIATAKDFEVSYINGSYEYTGSDINPDPTDIRVKDVNGGNSVDGAVLEVYNYTNDINVGANYSATASVDVSKFKNYTGTSVTMPVSGKYSIVARNLNNCTVTVPAQASTGKKAIVDPNGLIIKDAAGNPLTLGRDVNVIVPDNATVAGTYSVTIVPKTGNKNVTGSVNAELKLFAEDISKIADLDDTAKAELAKVAHFTGSQITKDVSKIVGHVLNTSDKNKPIDTNQYTVEFGTNVNAGPGAGIVRIVGQNTYANSVAEFPFDITPARIAKKEIAESVYDVNVKKASEYAPKITLTAKNGANATWTLEEGKDYTVKYDFTEANGNKVGARNIVITVTYSTDAQNNYGLAKTETLYGAIVYPSLTNASIKMEKTSYEYTGAAIVPEYKVYDGTKELKENVDYVVKNTVGGKDVGTATLVIAGAPGSKYNPNATATATFEITPVSAEKVEVKTNKTYTYNGTQQDVTIKDIVIKLNDNDVTAQFDIASNGTNVNAGKEAGSYVIAPKKDNKNFTAGTTKNVVFEIKQKALAGGTLKVYNEKGIEIKELTDFDYDGTAKEFAKAVYTPADKLATVNDYEVKYVNNTTGDENNDATIVVIAKGNFTAAGTIKDVENDTVIKEVVTGTDVQRKFKINSKLYFTEKEVTVTDAEYAGLGMLAKPTIVVKDGGKTLVEGKDYTVTLKKGNTVIQGAQEPGTTVYTWEVNGKGVYKDIVAKGPNNDIAKNTASGTWKLNKKDVANLDITVDLDAAGNPVLTVMNGNLRIDNKNFDLKLSDDKKTATVSATAGNKYYVNSTEVTVGGEVAVIETPVIADVKVVGNKATVVLSGECDGATGYDYVISTNGESSDPNRLVNKNVLATNTTFNYLQQGMYYAHCHAWKRVDGKKVFSGYSKSYPFVVSAITPSQPMITKVTRTGTTVKVTYTESTAATGYDVVLGSAAKKVNGELRPVNYGTLVKKVYSGNTVTATFKNVPTGKTFYAGLHAYNRTSEDGKKVFSRWSNVAKVPVK